MFGFIKRFFRKSKYPTYSDERIAEMGRNFSVFVVIQLKANSFPRTIDAISGNEWVFGYIWGVAEAAKDLYGIGRGACQNFCV